MKPQTCLVQSLGNFFGDPGQRDGDTGGWQASMYLSLCECVLPLQREKVLTDRTREMLYLQHHMHGSRFPVADWSCAVGTLPSMWTSGSMC